jgi:hypothetical protein
MVHKSLHLKLPNQKPFDSENWFESFVGNFVKPILDTGFIKQYWFSRYGKPGDRDIRFRFTVDDYNQIQSTVNTLLTTFSLTDLKDEEDYDWLGDLGGQRFLQNNKREVKKAERAQLVFDYLHSVSRLFVDSLSHSDHHGYFFQEQNTDLNNPYGSIFESLHHLFCNMTDVTTMIAEGELNSKKVVQSEFYFPHLQFQAKQRGEDLIYKKSYKVNF